MKLGIQINEGPYQHQAADSAYQFAKAALAKGHEIFRYHRRTTAILRSSGLNCRKNTTLILLSASLQRNAAA